MKLSSSPTFTDSVFVNNKSDQVAKVGYVCHVLLEVNRGHLSTFSSKSEVFEKFRKEDVVC